MSANLHCPVVKINIPYIIFNKYSLPHVFEGAMHGAFEAWRFSNIPQPVLLLLLGNSWFRLWLPFHQACILPQKFTRTWLSSRAPLSVPVDTMFSGSPAGGQGLAEWIPLP